MATKTIEDLGVSLTVTDVSGQKVFSVPSAPPDISVNEFILGMLSQMNLPQNDSAGQPLTYHARLEREGRHLFATERLGDAVAEGDVLSLQPNIDAGGNH